MIYLYALAIYAAVQLILWVLLFDEFLDLVCGWQMKNFTFPERLRLAVILPGIPLLILLTMLVNFREWREFPDQFVNMGVRIKDHWGIIVNGERYD